MIFFFIPFAGGAGTFLATGTFSSGTGLGTSGTLKTLQCCKSMFLRYKANTNSTGNVKRKDNKRYSTSKTLAELVKKEDSHHSRDQQMVFRVNNKKVMYFYPPQMHMSIIQFQATQF